MFSVFFNLPINENNDFDLAEVNFAEKREMVNSRLALKNFEASLKKFRGWPLEANFTVVKI